MKKKNVFQHNVTGQESLEKFGDNIKNNIASSCQNLQRAKNNLAELSKKDNSWKDNIRKNLLLDTINTLNEVKQQKKDDDTEIRHKEVLSESINTPSSRLNQLPEKESSPTKLKTENISSPSYTWEMADQRLKRQLEYKDQQINALLSDNKRYTHQLAQKNHMIRKYKERTEKLEKQFLEGNTRLISIEENIGQFLNTLNNNFAPKEERLIPQPISGKQPGSDDEEQSGTKRTWVNILSNLWNNDNEEEYKKLNSNLKTKVANLESELTEMNELVQQLNQTVAMIEQKETEFYKELENQGDETKDKVNNNVFRAKVINLEKELAALNELVLQLNSTIEAFEEKDKEAEGKEFKNEFQPKLTNLEKELTALNELVQQLSKTVASFEQNEAELSKEKEEKESKDNEVNNMLKSKIINLEKEVASINELVHLLNKTVGALEENDGTITEEKKEDKEIDSVLQSKLTTIESELAELKNLFQQLNKTVSTFEQKDTNMQEHQKRTNLPRSPKKNNRQTSQYKSQSATHKNSQNRKQTPQNPFIKEHQKIQTPQPKQPTKSKQPPKRPTNRKQNTNPYQQPQKRQPLRPQQVEQGGDTFNPLKYNYRPPQ